MKISKIPVLLLIVLLSYSCVSIERIARHDFNSNYFKLKTEGNEPRSIYADVSGDSITIYPVIFEGNLKQPDTNHPVSFNLMNVKTGDNFSRSTFVYKSVDIDLSTILFKYRPEKQGVPGQLNFNLNGAIYTGIRRDFYRITPYKSPLKVETSYINHIGFDAGFFAGIGTTAVNPTVTLNKIDQEYDGLVFQKGIAAFITFGNFSVGLACGFDNLLDKNKSVWIYNQKPYLGIVIGIANF
jgi:hypothetical protein